MPPESGAEESQLQACLFFVRKRNIWGRFLGEVTKAAVLDTQKGKCVCEASFGTIQICLKLGSVQQAGAPAEECSTMQTQPT